MNICPPAARVRAPARARKCDPRGGPMASTARVGSLRQSGGQSVTCCGTLTPAPCAAHRPHRRRIAPATRLPPSAPATTAPPVPHRQRRVADVLAGRRQCAHERQRAIIRDNPCILLSRSIRACHDAMSTACRHIHRSKRRRGRPRSVDLNTVCLAVSKKNGLTEAGQAEGKGKGKGLHSVEPTGCRNPAHDPSCRRRPRRNGLRTRPAGCASACHFAIGLGNIMPNIVERPRETTPRPLHVELQQRLVACRVERVLAWHHLAPEEPGQPPRIQVAALERLLAEMLPKRGEKASSAIRSGALRSE